ncbi:MAG TPA: hypothetical protein VM618_10185 [Acidimicrobiia bacterium]|nr:hypothetical protein [Acidimicrobiia bacterium]
MSRPSRFEEHQYLGDKRTLVVHDLDAAGDECAIAEIVAENKALGFGPDTLAEARNRGYRPCRRCIPKQRVTDAA